MSAACAHRRASVGGSPTPQTATKKQPKPKAMGAEASAPEASPRDPAFSEREPQSATSWLFGTDLLCGGDAGCTLTYTCLPDPSKGEFQVDQAVSAAARDTRSASRRRSDRRPRRISGGPGTRRRRARASSVSRGATTPATRLVRWLRRGRDAHHLPVAAPPRSARPPRSAGPCTGVRLDRPKHERRDRGFKQ